jgi:pyrimidine-nucleoside phosphorylase
MKLGAGRAAKDDVIDHAAGIMLIKKPGDRVKRGDVVAILYTNRKTVIDEVRDTVLDAIKLDAATFTPDKMIYEVVR